MMEFVRVLLIALVLAFITACGSTVSAGSSEHSSADTPELAPGFARCNPYAALIQQFSDRYLPQWDWRWLAAQIWQESLCDTRAVSPAGAQGLGQFMPGTWSDMCQALGWRNVSPFSPKPNIQASALYMSKQRQFWSGRNRTEPQIRPLAQANYNAGAGNILKAQRLCANALEWTGIQPCLVRVTGRHSIETTNYIHRIDRHYRQMTRGDYQ